MSQTHVGEWSLDLAVEGIGLERESGDLHVFQPFPDGVLIGAIDGLGHGPEAARASRAIAEELASRPDEPLDRLIQRCHARARGTRGGVLTLASFSSVDASLSWCGIGNVDGRLFRARPQPPRLVNEAVAQRGGVVGYQIPSVRCSTLEVDSGDVLVLATDGIKSGFEKAASTYLPAMDIAHEVLSRHARGNDDALVTVVRFLKQLP